MIEDNLFANLGGTAVGRSDYQVGNFARNFPIGGFTFRNNLLFIHPVTAPVDSLGTPLATDPGWYSGSEFDTNGQPAGLRFSVLTDASPFVDPGHTNRNFALDPASPAGRAAYLGATGGLNLGAWQVPPARIAVGEGVVISWDSVTGLSYGVESAGALEPGTWSPVASALPGTGENVAVTNGAPVAGPVFYRAVIE